MTKKTLVIAIPIAAVLLNGVGYLIYRSRTPPPLTGSDTRGGRSVPAPPHGENAPSSQGNGRGRATAPEDDEASREARAKAHRAAGLAALEAGKYDKALINFTEAKALIGDKANVADLLQVTEELRRNPGTARTRSEIPSPPERERVRKAASRGSTRRLAVQEATIDESASSAPAGGLLIVSTTPRGILVHVDDAAVDLTPMKTKVKPGLHRVALFDGDHKVFETSVDVKEGGTATLVHDLSSLGATEAPSPVAPPPAVPALPTGEAPRAMTVGAGPSGVASAASSPVIASAVRATQPSAAVARAAGGLGTLDISVPGLYGVVWVNGRPRGYPPLAVPDLPPGPAKVEVRVNGVQKRAVTAVVRPGVTTLVKLRSSEANP